MSIEQSATRNVLLRSLAPADFLLLAPHLVQTQLRQGDVVVQSDCPVKTVLFPESGLVSIISKAGSLQAEAGLVGREGLVDFAVLLGNNYPTTESVIQVGGAGWLIENSAVCTALEESATLRASLMRFVPTMMTQITQTVLANAKMRLDHRLARWILMCHDRLDTDEVPLTHQYIAIMLGVRRASVTTAMQELESQLLIRAVRGTIVVRNRNGLESLVGAAYGKPEAEYARLIGTERRVGEAAC